MKAFALITYISLAVFLLSCGKDKFESKPKIEIKEYSSTEIGQGQQLVITLEYFDKEGDLGTGPFLSIRNRLNRLPIPPTQEKADTFRYSLPEFPERDNGEITFTLPWDFLKESLIENDTLSFNFSVTDLAGNTSDTITSDHVVILLP